MAKYWLTVWAWDLDRILHQEEIDVPPRLLSMEHGDGDESAHAELQAILQPRVLRVQQLLDVQHVHTTVTDVRPSRDCGREVAERYFSRGPDADVWHGREGWDGRAPAS